MAKSPDQNPREAAALAEAAENLKQALKVENKLQCRRAAADDRELLRARRAVDRCAAAYVTAMQDYVAFFERRLNESL